MKVKAGEQVRVVRSRKNPMPYLAKATKDFDTEADEWWPLILDQDEPVFGITRGWGRGDELSPRRGIDVIEKVV